MNKPTLLCIKRIHKEYIEICEASIPNIKIYYDENNILKWYCMIYDLTDQEYIDGEYIFSIEMSSKYPFEPPNFIFLTPNGRFDINTKLCFSNSSYHKESWSPLWTLKTIILGFLSFFLEKKSFGIGHLETTILDKQKYALTSKEFNTKMLGHLHFN
jgi:ubiquitin-conjugating enzyme E2 J2